MSYTFEDLIDSVKRRPEIWQRSHPQFSNPLRKKSWGDISKELKTHEIRLRKSWKYLVDQFRKELKVKKQNEGKPVSNIWAYYHNMLFLKDEIVKTQGRRKIKARITSAAPNNESNSTAQESNSGKNHETIDDTNMSNNLSHSNTADKRFKSAPVPLKDSSHGATTSIDKCGNEWKYNTYDKPTSSGVSKADLILLKLNSLNKEMKDDDFMFVMSILPVVRTLPMMKKLQLRAKINEWLLQALSEDPLNSAGQHLVPIESSTWCEGEDNKDGVLQQIMDAEDEGV